jgi:hypothetical protein
MKFTFTWKKHTRTSAGITPGHNRRADPTRSQLPKQAWFDPRGHYTGGEFNRERLNEARMLAKRKDAVVAIEFIVQVGDQTDWREEPTQEYPYGKPKSPPFNPKRLMQLAYKALSNEFGKENIVDVSLHLDETSPHVHVIAVPITKDGRLCAKDWLDGAKKCAELRERVHAVISREIKCDYEKGAPGGGEKPDKNKRAGANETKRIIDKLIDAFSAKDKVSELQARIKKLEKQLQIAFSRQKKALLDRDKAIKKYEDEKKMRERAEYELKRSLNAGYSAGLMKIEVIKDELEQTRKELEKTKEQLNEKELELMRLHQKNNANRVRVKPHVTPC